MKIKNVLKITCAKNDKIKFATKLNKFKKHRHNAQQFVIEGVKICKEALKKGMIKQVFYTERFLKNNFDLINDLLNVTKECFEITSEIEKIISDTQTPQGIFAICNFFDKPKNFCKMELCRKIVVLENLQNPLNLGAIIRTCDALGIDKLVISDGSCDIYNPKTVRACMGSLFNLNILKVKDTNKFVQSLHKIGFTTYAMVLDDDAEMLSDIEFSPKSALIFGSEGNGLSEKLCSNCTKKLKIPMKSLVDSFNVGVAAGIAIWELTGRGK